MRADCGSRPPLRASPAYGRSCRAASIISGSTSSPSAATSGTKPSRRTSFALTLRLAAESSTISTVLALRSGTSPLAAPAAIVMLAGGRAAAAGNIDNDGNGGAVGTARAGVAAVVVAVAEAAAAGAGAAGTITVGSSPAGRVASATRGCTSRTAVAVAAPVTRAAAGGDGGYGCGGGGGGGGGDDGASTVAPRPLPCKPMRHAIKRSSSSTARWPTAPSELCVLLRVIIGVKPVAAMQGTCMTK